ncbi:hypothetical protein LJC30_04400 [Odoribacter sp. OttesenSCG-928-L07]|nr:hypothetical protein [Odoribacter sp. OttesenSCG-928-L07]
MRKILTIIISMLISSCLFAQKNKDDNPFRFEVNIGSNSTESSPCHAINCNEYGVAVCYIISTASSGQDSLAFVLKLLDVNLEPFKESSFMLPADFYIQAYSKHNNDIYIVLSATTRKNSTNIMTVKFNLESGMAETLTMSYENIVYINEVSATNNVAYISFSDKKNRGHLLSMNFTNKQSSFIYTSNDNISYNILSLTNFPKENHLYLSITQKTEQTNKLSLYELNGGSSKLRFEKNFGDSIYLTYAAPIRNINGKINTIIGAYYSGNMKNIFSANGYGYSASGIYSLNINSSKMDLYPYRQIDKDVYFTWHVPIKFNDIDSLSTSYIFTTEAYSPRYKTTPHTDYDFYGRPYTRYYQEFVGYITIQASNYIFDDQGKLLWIANTDIENALTLTQPHRKVVVDVIDDEILNAYFAIDHIGYKFLDKQNRSEAQEKFYPAKKHNKDIIEREYDSKIEHWYDNNYLVYGYQSIKNNSISRNSRRTVFYVQKVSL